MRNILKNILKNILRKLLLYVGVWLCLIMPTMAQGQSRQSHDAPHPHHPLDARPGSAEPSPPQENAPVHPFELPDIPDTALIDQDGNTVRFRSDVLAGNVVVLNFIFTTCTTICSPMGAVFAGLQHELAAKQEHAKQAVRFVSISIDPVTDTPARLKAWAERFGRTSEWTLLTGEKTDVDELLKKLGVFSALKEEHAPLILLGNETTRQWLRTYGLASPRQLAALLNRLRQPSPTSSGPTSPGATPDQAQQAGHAAARAYFTDLILLDQTGQKRRFYTDLIQGKSVVINAFFADCTDSCPVTHATMVRIQQMLSERLGRDVHLLSISVDPTNDTPQKLAAYAQRFMAQTGWYFLTGSAENVNQILYKLGHQVAQRESHKSIFLIGNDKTQLWKKAFALAPASEIIDIVRSVVEDAG